MLRELLAFNVIANRAELAFGGFKNMEFYVHDDPIDRFKSLRNEWTLNVYVVMSVTILFSALWAYTR